MKEKTLFECQNCGRQEPKWLGRCPDCGSWNSFDVVAQVKPSAGRDRRAAGVSIPLTAVETKEVNRLDPDMKVFGKPCPLLVPLVEEGRTADDPIVRAVVWEYLSEFEGLDLDTLILGCTHYPVIKDAVAQCMEEATIVDSASATAKAVADNYSDLLTAKEDPPSYTFYVSDNPDRFREIGKRMTGLPLDDVRLVDLSDIVTA